SGNGSAVGKQAIAASYGWGDRPPKRAASPDGRRTGRTLLAPATLESCGCRATTTLHGFLRNERRWPPGAVERLRCLRGTGALPHLRHPHPGRALLRGGRRPLRHPSRTVVGRVRLGRH